MSESVVEEPKMPVLFMGHGSPMNIISDNKFTQDLKNLGKNLPKPKAILVVSAHWLTSGTRVLCTRNPKLIYDFYGFPKGLYEINYPSPGSPELANLICDALKAYDVKCDYEWGYDHASWSILKHIYPNADIPVIELSLDYGFNRWNLKPIEYHYHLAKNLSFLRKNGVLIIGSGNIVHNLGIIDYKVEAPIMEWAKQLDERVKQNLLNQNHQKLIEFKKMGDVAKMGIPTWDHYLPLIYTIALQEKDEKVKFVHEGFQHGSVSMRCIQIG
ncbi:MAG: 4,5-DOPA dioxygenase extradiol [Candidatus Heimdallarchaeota archaeon]